MMHIKNTHIKVINACIEGLCADINKLTADNAALIEALEDILKGQSKIVHSDRVKANEALEQAKGDV